MPAGGGLGGGGAATIGGNVTLTLPAANAATPKGMVKRVKKVDADTTYWCRVYPPSGNTLYAGASSASYATVAAGETWEFVSDASAAWHAYKVSP